MSEFITGQTCATICYVDEDGNPFCFNCFYAFNSKEGLLYYKSSPNTKHSINIISNPTIAGTILPDKLNRLQVRGVQFEGTLLSPEEHEAKTASSHYYKKHPLAITIPGEIFTIQVHKIKFTDNSLGFGKKILWNREETSERVGISE